MTSAQAPVYSEHKKDISPWGTCQITLAIWTGNVEYGVETMMY